MINILPEPENANCSYRHYKYDNHSHPDIPVGEGNKFPENNISFGKAQIAGSPEERNNRSSAGTIRSAGRYLGDERALAKNLGEDEMHDGIISDSGQHIPRFGSPGTAGGTIGTLMAQPYIRVF